MPEFIFTDDMGELSGWRKDNPDYEACCRRMVIAAAEWLDAHPNPMMAFNVLVPEEINGQKAAYVGVWTEGLEPQTSDAVQLCAALDAAGRADRGPEATPSFLMMEVALRQARFINDHGWDVYCAERRRQVKDAAGPANENQRGAADA